MPERTDGSFSEEEAKRILKRAAEFQDVTDPSDSLSGEQVIRVGSEAGIDPSFIRAAMAEGVPASEITSGRTEALVFGCPAKFSLHRHVRSPLSDSTWAAVVGQLVLRHRVSIQGLSSGRVRTWNLSEGDENLSVTAEESETGFRLTLTRSLEDGAVARMIYSLIGWAACSVLALFVPGLRSGAGIVLAVALLVGILVWVRTMNAKWFREQWEADQELLETIARAAEMEQGEESSLSAFASEDETTQSDPLASLQESS